MIRGKDFLQELLYLQGRFRGGSGGRGLKPRGLCGQGPARRDCILRGLLLQGGEEAQVAAQGFQLGEGLGTGDQAGLMEADNRIGESGEDLCPFLRGGGGDGLEDDF